MFLAPISNESSVVLKDVYRSPGALFIFARCGQTLAVPYNSVINYHQTVHNLTVATFV
jgi:hypothetical protein